MERCCCRIYQEQIYVVTFNVATFIFHTIKKAASSEAAQKKKKEEKYKIKIKILLIS